MKYLAIIRVLYMHLESIASRFGLIHETRVQLIAREINSNSERRSSFLKSSCVH